jgi:tRNA nucleotidyltransferase (CCA-adding enzyme)
MQFAGRFDLRAAPETAALCDGIKSAYGELAVERVREEWFKWAGLAAVPSAGLRFLIDSGWIDHFPEIKSLVGVPQEPAWHPEGDVFIHTRHCCDALARLPAWRDAAPPTRVVYMMAILTHDFGKPETTRRELKDGVERIVSPGHDEAGARLAGQFLTRINAPSAVIERVIPLVANHLFSFQELTDHAIRRLAKRLEPSNIEDLCVIMTADSLGRPPRPPKVPESVTRLLAKARDLKVRQNAPRPILLGRHLIEHGLTPGPAFHPILEAAYDAQLEGTIHDLPSALEWLKARAGKIPS